MACDRQFGITSDSTLLHVKLENSAGVMKCDPDYFIVNVQSSLSNRIYSATLTLSDENVQINFPIPFTGNKPSERIRLDTFFSLVFNAGDSVHSVPQESLESLLEGTKKRVDLNIRLETAIDSKHVPNRPALVHTATIIVGNNHLPVSREVLVYSSNFFASLFDGNYCEKKKGVYQIKDVDFDEFSWFINSFVSKDWKFCCGVPTDDEEKELALESALLALKYADRFGFINHNTRIFSYLETLEIPKSILLDTLVLIGRFNYNQRTIRKIFKQCKDDSEAFQLLHDSAPNMSGGSIQTAIKAAQKVVHQFKMKEKVEAMSDAVSEGRDEDLGVVIVCHDEENDIVSVDAYTTWCTHEVEMNSIWERLDEQYNLVKINGKEYRREEFDEEDYRKVDAGYRSVDIDAYITSEEYIPVNRHSDSDDSNEEIES